MKTQCQVEAEAWPGVEKGHFQGVMGRVHCTEGAKEHLQWDFKVRTYMYGGKRTFTMGGRDDHIQEGGMQRGMYRGQY